MTVWHLRMLTENSWNGGAGYTPQQVGDMTPDQIMFRLCELDLLRAKPGKRVRKLEAAGVMQWADADGRVAGRAADGTPIRAKITGKSLARQLREQEEQERIEAAKAGRKTDGRD